MSQENVEIVRRTLDALDRRDFQSAMCGFHIDAVWHNTGQFPGERICVGPQAIVDFWEALIEPFQNESREVERLVESEDVVVLSLRSVARGRTMGYRSTCVGAQPSSCATARSSASTFGAKLP